MPIWSHSTTTSLFPTPGDVALALAQAGFHLVPICSPGPGGSCAFAIIHKRPQDCGKQPLLGQVWQHKATHNVKQIVWWWRRWPAANIGVALEPSGTVVVDPDTDEAQQEAAVLGLDGGLSRYSRQRAYFFKRPTGCPAENVIQTGRSAALDLLAKGQVVVYGRHLKGCDVFLEAPDGGLAPSLDDLSDAPVWVVAELQRAARQRETQATPRPPTTVTAADVRQAVARLSRYGWGLWTGALVVSAGRVVPLGLAKNGVDRSATLFALGAALARAGANEPTISSALAERDVALGYGKFAARPEARAASEYQRIASKVIATARAPRPRSAPVVPGQWEWTQ